MLSGVTVIGFIGYLLLGLSAFDSLYMTVITITTVGFSEIGAPEEITAAYQTFTLLLALFGVGTALYTLGVSFEAFPSKGVASVDDWTIPSGGSRETPRSSRRRASARAVWTSVVAPSCTTTTPRWIPKAASWS